MTHYGSGSHPAVVGSPQVTPGMAIKLIQKQIDKAAPFIEQGSIPLDSYDTLNLSVQDTLEKAFGVGSQKISHVIDISTPNYMGDASDSEWEKEYAKLLVTKNSRMEGLIEILKSDIEIGQEAALIDNSATPSSTVKAQGERVFIVHGHNQEYLSKTARFLENLGFKVTILNEEPNNGRTIVEKFEQQASDDDIGFAVVLMTADDIGRAKTDPPENELPRARQNAVLELGFFMAKLGRNRTCALYERGVEMPSDFNGVLYIELDNNDAWKTNLAKEMKSVGFPVDMNLV